MEGIPVSYMFNVEVEGKANAVFDTADEAVRYAMHHVYLQAHEFQSAVDTLNSKATKTKNNESSNPSNNLPRLNFQTTTMMLKATAIPISMNSIRIS